MEQAAPRPRLRLRTMTANLPLMVGLAIALGFTLVVLFGPLWASYDPYITIQTTLPHYDSELNQMVQPPFPPSADFPLGTDNWGNDLLSLLLYGARTTLVAAAYITLLRLVLGAVLGFAAGWKAGGVVDQLVMGLVAALGSVPLLLSGMILIFALDIDNGLVVFLVALSALGWTEIAQYVRGELQVIRQMAYVEAARAGGLTALQIAVRHALPNILPQLVVIAFLEMGAVLLLIAELGFLDVFIGRGSQFSLDRGVRPFVLLEIPEWGALIAQGAPGIRANPHLVIGPAVTFLLAITGLNSLGEGLRRLLNHSMISTGFLLSRRMAVATAAFIVLSIFVVGATGPKLSYGRLAERFDGRRAYDHVQAMAGRPDGAAVAEYIREVFRELEVRPGGINGLQSSYFQAIETGAAGQAVQASSVIGFLPGYDLDHVTELVIILAPFDATATGPAAAGELAGVGVLLELARLWQEAQVDSRRSVLLVAWGGGRLDPAVAQAFVEDAGNFSHLPARVPIDTPHVPTVLVQPGAIGSGGDTVWLAPGSDERLLDVFRAAARQAGMPTTTDPAAAGPGAGHYPEDR